MRPFVVCLPFGLRYWTVLDDELDVVGPVDEFLRHLRLGQDAAEGTTRTYAGALTLWLRWCVQTGRGWERAGEAMGAFLLWLQRCPGGDEPAEVVAGPGAGPVRGERRCNVVLAAVREFIKFQVARGRIEPGVLAQLYSVTDDRGLPEHLRDESGRVRYVASVRHRLREPDTGLRRASDQEAVALLGACRSARDRLMVLLLARVGLRRGELVGLRREDIHFLPSATVLGCAVPGAHLHVVRRDNPNGAWAKSRRARAVPVDGLVVRAYDQYVQERERYGSAADGDFVLVNLFRPPVGVPMRLGAVNEMLAAASRRAGLPRVIHPHLLRHAFASNVLDAGGTLDEAQHLLGHACISSTQVYAHPDHDRLRAAVERVAAPAGTAGGQR